jgi:hypothetical protein
VNSNSGKQSKINLESSVPPPPDRHVLRDRTRESKSGKRQETAGAPSMSSMCRVGSGKIQPRVFQVNTNGAMGLANVVRSNLGNQGVSVVTIR